MIEGGAYTASERSSPSISSKQTVPPKESVWRLRESHGAIERAKSPNPIRPGFISVSSVNWPVQDRSLNCRSLSSRSEIVRCEEGGPSIIPLMASSMRYVRSASVLMRLRKRQETCKRMGNLT